MPLHRTAFGPEISLAASAHGLDPTLVESMVIVESAGKTSAFRFEPDYFRRYLAKDPFWASQNPLRVASSYGLLQLMFPTAVQVGFPKTDPPELLFVPATGLEYACRYLAWLQKKFPGDRDAMIAAYNAGPGNARRSADGTFPNQTYVDKVRKHLAAA